MIVRHSPMYLVVISAMLSAGMLEVTLNANSIGDCLQIDQEANRICDDVQPCTPSGCVAYDDGITCEDGSCNPSPCKAALFTDVRNFGACKDTDPPIPSNCTYCKTYYCASAFAYQSKDANGQCQTQRCPRVVPRSRACVP